MTLRPTPYEHQHLHKIAHEYRKRGYEVLIRPTPDQLPAFLMPFPIDMLAHNSEENVVVEVRTRESLIDAPRLDAVAQVLQGKPSWRFELVVRNLRERAGA